MGTNTKTLSLFQKRLWLYARLTRLHQPRGIGLLLWPCLTALFVSSHGSLSGAQWFILGAVATRTGGCLINDWADRNIDGYVERTSHRPLATGEATLMDATLALMVSGLCALWALVMLPIACWYWAALSALLMTIYPYCKRIIRYPQLVLSVVFSLGIPMACVSVHHAMTSIGWIMFFLNACWVFAYDTQYALADLKDDQCLPIHSSAKSLGHNAIWVIRCGQSIFCVGWLYLAKLLHMKMGFYTVFSVIAIMFMHCDRLIRKNQAQHALKAFLLNNRIGILLFIAVVLFFPY